MDKYKYAVITGAVTVVIIGAVWMMNTPTVQAPGGGQVCTMEAKLCPDGSAVGRTGPNCEFASCPGEVATSTAGKVCTKEARLCSDGSAVGRTGPNCEFTACPTTGGTVTLAVGQDATIRGTTISVIGPVEDSRCPADVQCIWAGTVGVHVLINSSNSDFTFTLNQPQVVGNATITLSSVTPAQKYSQQTIQQSDYRFTFSVVPKVSTTSGVRGTISLGPTCPVERIPPDPVCAEKPYATTIAVYRTGSSSVFITGKSDAKGAFEFSLPSGLYTLTAAGGTTLPRCASVDVTVATNGYTTTHISCDTGIR